MRALKPDIHEKGNIGKLSIDPGCIRDVVKRICHHTRLNLGSEPVRDFITSRKPYAHSRIEFYFAAWRDWAKEIFQICFDGPVSTKIASNVETLDLGVRSAGGQEMC